MNNKILIIGISAVIGGIVLLGAGYLAGISLEKEKTKSQLEKLERATSALNSLSSSKVIPSIVAFGEVTKISGRTITLTYGTENLPIRIKEDAKIYSFNTPTPGQETPLTGPIQTESTFEAIKAGDNLNISVKVSPDGELEGLSVIIFLPFNNAR